MKIKKTLTLLATCAVSTSPLFAEEASAPAAKTPAPIESLFTEEQLADFKERRAEIQKSGAVLASSFVNTDKNADGIWTWEEAKAHDAKKFKKHGKEPRDFRPIFDTFDSNGDGYVTIDEHKKEFYPWMKENKARKKKLKEEAAAKAAAAAAEAK
jgi:hypothetical protein